MKKSKSRKTVNGTAAAPATRARVASLEELQALCREPIILPLDFGNGKTVEIEMFRLTVPQQEELLEILRKFTPPLVPSKVAGGKPEYNEEDPTYLKQVEGQMRISRAVGVYRACPVLQAAEHLTHDEIVKRLAEKLTDGVLDSIYVTLRTEDVRVADRANFTTAPVSPGS